MNNNGRLRRILTQFLNRENRSHDDEAMDYLNNQMRMIDEQIKSINSDMMNISNLYYEALSEGNIEQSLMLENQLKDMKERKKRYKQQKKQIKDNIDEIKDLQDIVEEQGEETRNIFGDAFDDLTDVIQTLNVMDIKDKIGDSVDSVNEVIREAANTLGLNDTEKKALTDAIYENTNAVNKAAGKNIMSVNDAADDIAALVDAGMTNQDTIGQLAPILAEGNKLLGLESDEIADLAVKFQDNPDVVKNLYNMMASGKLNLPDEYKDYAIKGYEAFAEQSNEMAQVLRNYSDKGLDVNNINAQLLAINSTLEKNSLGDMDMSQMLQDANSMNTSEFAEAYGNQAALIQSRLQQGDMTALEDYINQALRMVQSGTPQEQWQTMFGDVLDYQVLKNSNASTDQVATDFQTYLSTYQGGINNDEVMNQLAQSHSMSPLEEFWNYFSGLPLIQSISTTLGDLDLSMSDIVSIGWGVTGILKNFPGLLKVFTKPLGGLKGLVTGGEGVGLFSKLGSLFSGGGAEGGGLLAGLGSKISSLFGGASAGAGAAGGSGLLAGLGKIAPWLSIGTAGIETVTGLYQGITSDDTKEKSRGYTKAGLTGGATAAGALIGSIIPGAGTLVGAGIGAAVGSIGDWLLGDTIAGWFGGDEEGSKEENVSNTDNPQSTENNATINNADDSTVGILNGIYSTINEWYNNYKGKGAINTSSINNGSLNAIQASYSDTISVVPSNRSITLEGGVLEDKTQYDNTSLINTNGDADYTKIIEDATTMSTEDFSSTYGTQAALIQGRLQQGDMTAIQDLIQSINKSYEAGIPQEQLESLYGNLISYESLNSNTSDKQVGVNNNPNRIMEGTMSDISTSNIDSQTSLANINAILFDWYNFYKNGERTKANTQSLYTAFNQGSTLTTASTPSNAYSNAPNASTPENINSGKVLEDFQENTGIKEGDNLDSGSDIAPGFEGSHKNGLDYVPYDGYIAELHKGEAVLTSNENLIWKTLKDSLDNSNNNEKSIKIDGSHKKGLDYVPHDGYIAELHKGEAVLTAKENKNYQKSNKYPTNVDYGEIRDLVVTPPGVKTPITKRPTNVDYGEIENPMVRATATKSINSSPMARANTNNTNNTNNTATGHFPTYALNESQINGLARICAKEQPVNDAAQKAEASIMGNLTDFRGNNRATVNNLIKTATGAWFSTRSQYYAGWTPSATSINAVRSTLVEGKRTLPRYVDNHDCFGDIDWVKNNGQTFNKRDRSQYKKDVTRIFSNFEAMGTFYGFPSPGSDPFYYNDGEGAEYKSKWGDFHYNPSGGSTTGSPGSGDVPTQQAPAVNLPTRQFEKITKDSVKKTEYKKTKFESLPIESVREENFINSMFLMDMLTSSKLLEQAASSMTDFENAVKVAQTPVTTTGTTGTTGSSGGGNFTPGASGDYLGRYGCAFETGGTSTKDVNPGQVSTLPGDSGGTSYGVYQMATNGEAPDFGKWLVQNYPNDIGKLFQGQSAGTSGFNNAWTTAYQQYGDKFLGAQVKFFARPGSDYQNWVSGLKRTVGLNLEENRGYQEMACSLAAHNGTGGESRWNKLVGQWYQQGKKGTDLVDAVCDARIEQWRNGKNTSQYGMNGAYNRWGDNSDERKTLKQLVSQPPIAYAQGTPWVPNDQVALIHKGEMVIPKQNNPLANGTKISSNNVTNNTSTISERETVRELKQLTSVLQQGIQYIGKKLDSIDTSNNKNTNQQNNSSSRGNTLYNLRDVYAKRQL